MNTFECLNFLLKSGVHIIAAIATIAKKKLRDQNDCMIAIVAIVEIEHFRSLNARFPYNRSDR